MSIQVENLTYIYGQGTPFEKKALDGLSVTIETGAFVGLIGHTGSGKSTLIQHLNRLMVPTKGTIEIFGEDINAKATNLKALRQRVGLVFQYPEHQLFEMTIYKDVAFGPTNMGLSEAEIERRVHHALVTVGMDPEDFQKSPFELSGGQKRRVAIAGVLAMEPDILILDEPTAGLDPKGSHEILQEIQSIHKKENNTIILVSHNMEDIAKYVDRLIVMDQGKVTLDGPPKQVFQQVEALEAMGLAVPSVTYLVKALNQKGFELPKDITTVSEAYEALKALLERSVEDDS